MDKNDDVKKNLLVNAPEEIRLTDDFGKEPEVIEQPTDVPVAVDSEQKGNDLFGTTTLKVSRDNDDYWAELEVRFSWSASGDLFTCEAQRYRARNNGNKRGNVYLSLSSSGSWGYVELTNDDAIQDGEWHTISGGGSVAGNFNYAWINFKFLYHRKSTRDVEMSVGYQKGFTIPVPTITWLKNVTASPFTMTGAGGIHQAGIIRVRKANSNATPANAHIQFDGKWSAVVDFPTELVQFDTQAWQQVGTKSSEYRNWTVYRARFTSPANLEVLPISAVTFRGTAAPGSTVAVVSADYGTALAQPVVGSSSMTWQAGMTAQWPSGPLTVVARISDLGYTTVFTTPVTFRVLGHPVVKAADAPQDQIFTLTGSNGLIGATVEIYEDLASVSLGKSAVLTSNQWAVGLKELRPGPISLVAEQTFNGVNSGRSAPTGFKIRPPAFVKVNVEFTPDGSIRFSGTAHPDATVVITAPGSPVRPPPEIVATGGNWTTIATGWPFGIYSLNIVQKVRDGASGWIESLSYVFQVQKQLPDVSDVGYTQDYQPTFSGKGHNGATVQPRKPNSADLEAPAVVVASGQWSSKASAVWGPVFEREVHIKQVLDEHESPNWVVLKVTIPPLAPGLEPPVEEGLSPFFKGTCWPGATVNITFSDDPTSYAATVQGELWTFRRSTDFDPGVHTVSVTQRFAEQNSLAADATFTVQIPMLKPRITAPAAGDEVGSDVEICGNNGMQFATMQLYNALFDRAVGNPLHLENSGDWCITLSDLEFGQFTVYAVQKLDSRESERSENHALKVVLLPPRITTPEAGGKLAREATLEGTGRAGGWVDVWLDGDDEPWQRNITVGANNLWRREVELPVGCHTLRARQSFDDNGTVHESACTDWMSFNVVPAAPFIETPVEGEPIGPQAVVSGFGVRGDTITVTLIGGAHSVLASTIVGEDRTWSVMCDCAAVTGGDYQLEAVASLDTFESGAAQRAVVLGVFLPILDEPAPGAWGVLPLQFAGRGRQGIGTLASWYNPEVLLTAELAIVGGQWRGESIRALPEGGNWYRFRQTITDGAAGETISARVVSARFEVELTRAPGKYR